MFHVKHEVKLPEFEQMRSDCSELGYILTERNAELFSVFAELLSTEAKKTNLIGAKEVRRLWERHILESIAYLKLLNPSAGVVDIGSGAGFPGIILAVCGLSVTLIEPRKRRFEFLKKAKQELRIPSLSIICGRIETLPAFPDGTQFTGRAVRGPQKLIELIRKGGCRKFSLVYRVPGDSKVEENNAILLPVPPLDRGGILVQYQIDEKNISLGR